MSTKLERAQKARESGKITYDHHQRIVLAERNKQVRALKDRLREADARLRQFDKEYVMARAVIVAAYKLVDTQDDALAGIGAYESLARAVEKARRYGDADK